MNDFKNTLFGRFVLGMLLALILAACGGAEVQYDPAPVEAPTPSSYAPVTVSDDGKYELMESFSPGTSVTLINHLTGDIFQTGTVRTVSRVHYEGGRYQVSPLAQQPDWPAPEHLFGQLLSITAVVGLPVDSITLLPRTPIKDKKLIAKLNQRIREEGLLDSVLGNDKAAQHERDYLADKLPTLYAVHHAGRRIIVIAYPEEFPGEESEMGAKFLLENDHIHPLSGGCTSLPHFYAHGGHIFFRNRRGGCESGDILVSNYVVLADSVEAEWATYAYAN